MSTFHIDECINSVEDLYVDSSLRFKQLDELSDEQVIGVLFSDSAISEMGIETTPERLNELRSHVEQCEIDGDDADEIAAQLRRELIC